MIHRYSDHAANERTFLAWVRTAISVMAFGFLVEKFDLFLEIAAHSLAGRAPSETTRLVGDFAGLLLILLGGAMMIVATLRFRQIQQQIDAAEIHPAMGTRMDVGLILLLLALTAALFGYLLYAVLRRLSQALRDTKRCGIDRYEEAAWGGAPCLLRAISACTRSASKFSSNGLPRTSMLGPSRASPSIALPTYPVMSRTGSEAGLSHLSFAELGEKACQELLA